MKPCLFTLVGLLAASVAASPVVTVNHALAIRGGAKGSNNADGAGGNAEEAQSVDGAEKQKGAQADAKDKQKDGKNSAKDDAKDGAGAGAGAGAADDTKKNGAADDTKKNGAADDTKKNGAADDTKKNGAADATNKNGTADASGGAANAAAGALVLPDGRIKADAVPEDFNVLASVFKSAVVKGDGLLFSDVVSFPDVESSLFDKATNTKAFAINIDDKSIFVPQGGEAQSNIRRADLLPAIISQLDNVAVTGTRTLHFSVQRDAANPLNSTHDYQLVSLESADFSFHQFDVRTGADNGDNIAILGNSKTTPAPEEIFSTPFGEGDFENFAMKLDFDANTVQVFHSTGQEPLKQVTEPVANDLAGFGEYHFALQKNPVGDAPQPAGIKEAVIYGGIFMEDSTDGTVSLQ